MHADAGVTATILLSQLTGATPGYTLGQGVSIAGNTVTITTGGFEAVSPAVDARAPQAVVLDVGSPATTNGGVQYVAVRSATAGSAGVRLYVEPESGRLFTYTLSGDFIGLLDPSLRYLQFSWEPGVGVHVAQSASATGPFQAGVTTAIPAGFTTAELANTRLVLSSNGSGTLTLVTPNDRPSAVLAFMAASAVPSVAAVQAQGGAFAKYESDFAYYADVHWAADSTTCCTTYTAGFYDRAMIYYVWWARTGNPIYLDRANKSAIAARTYIESYNYTPFTYNLMIDGVALHALVTGDQHSAATVANVADAMGDPTRYWAFVAGNPGDNEGDSRHSARVLSAVLDAYLLKVPSPGGFNYATLLSQLEPRILNTQSADGAYRWPGQCNYNKPFMTGMLNDALIRYYTTFQADPNIVPAVKRAADYMWANDWLSTSSAFTYQDGSCTVNGNTSGPGPSPDLNNLIVSGYAFLGQQTGDASYYAKADAVFAGGVYSASVQYQKQFNQEYTASYRYLALRGGTGGPSANRLAGGARVAPTVGSVHRQHRAVGPGDVATHVANGTRRSRD